jgi:membrane protein DedA with SNARE-associated domain
MIEENTNAERNELAVPHNHPKWLGGVLIACVVALWVLGLVTGGAAPELLKNHPLTLMALAPRYRYMVVASPRIALAPFMGVGVLRLLASDPIYFMLGWVFGDKALAFFEDALGEQAMNSTRQFFVKAGTVMALFFAGPIICVLAGAARLNPKRFFTLDALGTIAVVAALRAFSNQLKGPINWFLRFNAKNSRTLLILSVVVTIVVVVRISSKRAGAVKDFFKK